MGFPKGSLGVRPFGRRYRADLLRAGEILSGASLATAKLAENKGAIMP